MNILVVLFDVLQSPLNNSEPSPEDRLGLTQWSSFRKPLLTLALVLPGATPAFSQAT